MSDRNSRRKRGVHLLLGSAVVALRKAEAAERRKKKFPQLGSPLSQGEIEMNARLRQEYLATGVPPWET